MFSFDRTAMLLSNKDDASMENLIADQIDEDAQVRQKPPHPASPPGWAHPAAVGCRAFSCWQAELHLHGNSPALDWKHRRGELLP